MSDHQNANAWIVTAIVFIVLFVLMTGTSIYLCILRQKRIREIREAKLIRANALAQQNQKDIKSPWYGGSSHIWVTSMTTTTTMESDWYGNWFFVNKGMWRVNWFFVSVNSFFGVWKGSGVQGDSLSETNGPSLFSLKIYFINRNCSFQQYT